MFSQIYRTLYVICLLNLLQPGSGRRKRSILRRLYQLLIRVPWCVSHNYFGKYMRFSNTNATVSLIVLDYYTQWERQEREQ